jgi:hypothetical protein
VSNPCPFRNRLIVPPVKAQHIRQAAYQFVIVEGL